MKTRSPGRKTARTPSEYLLGSKRDAPSVTSDWQVLREAIADVEVREVKNVLKDNGYLTEVWREDWKLQPSGVAQVFQALIEARGISAWHVHRQATDRLFASHPDLQPLFRVDMAAQRRKLLGALVAIVDNLQAPERLTPGRYIRSARGFGFDGRPRVALIYAVGEIVSGDSQSGPFSGQLVGSDTLARSIREARNDDSVRAIVLRVDSPGGSGTASDVIWREVGLARKEKPVVVSMGDTAASGGYYIAMNGDAIVAEPGTITGSIGVFSGKFNLRGLYDKIGLTKEILVRGRNAAMFSDYQPWSEEEKARIRALMESFYGEFVSKAAQGRKKTVEQIDRVAQGRVWTGADAVKLGLVDRLGGLEAALEVAREKAKIGPGEELSLVILPERKGFFDLLMERQEEGVRERLLSPEVRSMVRWAGRLSDRGPIARLPFELRVR